MGQFERLIQSVLIDADREDLAKVIEHEIELLDNKAAKAKATAAKKKTEGDALRDAVQATMNDMALDGTIKRIAEKYDLVDCICMGK